MLFQALQVVQMLIATNETVYRLEVLEVAVKKGV